MKLAIGQLVTHQRRWDYKLGLITKILYTEKNIPLYVVLWTKLMFHEPRTIWHLEDELKVLKNVYS